MTLRMEDELVFKTGQVSIFTQVPREEHCVTRHKRLRGGLVPGLRPKYLSLLRNAP